MFLPKTDRILLLLATINIIMFILHIHANCQDIYYFFQLTIIGQIFTISNFLLSIILHQKKSNKKVRRILSRFHLMSIALQTIVVIGFWGLRIFFRKGIIKQQQVYTWYLQILSIWVHGGSLVCLFYFIKADQIMSEKSNKIKYFIHLIWGLPFLFLQFLRWALTGVHIYGFLEHFTWPQLIVFQAFLFFLAVYIDYTLSVRHGLKLTLKTLNSQKKNLDQLESQKQAQDAKQYIKQEKQIQQLYKKQ